MKIIYFLCSYLFGAIPFGYLLFRLKEKKDVRTLGSKNIGATNILRLSGWKLAVPVLLLDITKGFVPVVLAHKLFPGQIIIVIIAGIMAILGHCFPVYIKFKGGKGQATSLGIYLALAPKPLLCILGVFFLIVIFTRYVSLGSIMASLSFPLFVILLKGEKEIVYAGLLILLLILIQHRENIKRLLSGNEKKIGEKTQ
jgi:glycerol-3-phosphate acyltransferase PlsY